MGFNVEVVAALAALDRRERGDCVLAVVWRREGLLQRGGLVAVVEEILVRVGGQGGAVVGVGGGGDLRGHVRQVASISEGAYGGALFVDVASCRGGLVGGVDEVFPPLADVLHRLGGQGFPIVTARPQQVFVYAAESLGAGPL